jgi:hypothetical protein
VEAAAARCNIARPIAFSPGIRRKRVKRRAGKAMSMEPVQPSAAQLPSDAMEADDERLAPDFWRDLMVLLGIMCLLALSVTVFMTAG